MKEMAFEYKRQFPKGEIANGNGGGTATHFAPRPPVPRDLGREQAEQRAESQSPRTLRLREHLDCEPPWDILRARASFDSPASPEGPWPDRFDVWPADMAGYWPCPICATP